MNAEAAQIPANGAEHVGVGFAGVAAAGADLPHALTFFLTSRQRAEVVRTLSRIDPRRERALLLALRVIYDESASGADVPRAHVAAAVDRGRDVEGLPELHPGAHVHREPTVGRGDRQALARRGVDPGCRSQGWPRQRPRT